MIRSSGASGGVANAQIVKAATSTIPIIFEVGFNPVQEGLVASLSRPGGNLTGVNSVIAELWPKHLDLMAKLLPNAHVFGALFTGGGDSPERVRLVRPAATATSGRPHRGRYSASGSARGARAHPLQPDRSRHFGVHVIAECRVAI